MKHRLDSDATKGRPKRPRAMDVADPSRPWLVAVNTTSAFASSLSSARSLDSAARSKVSQSIEECPHWVCLHEQLLCLPTNTPHCLPYIVDEAMSISPGAKCNSGPWCMHQYILLPSEGT